MDPKAKDILARINRLQEALAKGHEYLASGRHAHWEGFQALFAPKLRNGRKLPPHRDWVKNVFIPDISRALERSEKALDRLRRSPRRGELE